MMKMMIGKDDPNNRHVSDEREKEIEGNHQE